MNQPWFIVAIVAIVMIASVLRSRGHRSHRQSSGEDNASRLESERLRDEVKQLKERIQVLERITVEKEDTLSRQIEELRDRP